MTLGKTNFKLSQAQVKGRMDDEEWEMKCRVRGGGGMVRLSWKHPEQIVSRDGGARGNRPWSPYAFFRCQNLCLGEVCSWSSHALWDAFKYKFNSNSTYAIWTCFSGYLSANTHCILSPPQFKQHVFPPEDTYSLICAIYPVQHPAGWLQDKWK